MLLYYMHVGPTNSSVSQLTTDDHGISIIPEVITDCAP